MTQVIVEDPIGARFDGLREPVEVVDGWGRRLGHFVPAITPEGRAADEEVSREAQSRAEVWKTGVM